MLHKINYVTRKLNSYIINRKKNIYKNYIVMLQLKSEKVNLKYFFFKCYLIDI